MPAQRFLFLLPQDGQCGLCYLMCLTGVFELVLSFTASVCLFVCAQWHLCTVKLDKQQGQERDLKCLSNDDRAPKNVDGC